MADSTTGLAEFNQTDEAAFPLVGGTYSGQTMTKQLADVYVGHCLAQ